MAVGEAITNLMAAPLESLNRIKLSANWMAAAGHPGEDARLFDAVKAVGMELCPELELGIPVGKDSLSMQAQYQADGQAHRSVSPVSLVVSAFAPVLDVRGQLTPLLRRDVESELWLIGLGGGRQRMGGSVLAQCHPEANGGATLPAFGGEAPDLDDPQRLRALFELVRDAREDGLLLAYHDRSDGGVFAALCEMAFASHLGLDIRLDGWGDGRTGDPLRVLFNEELGAVVQVPVEERAAFADLVARHGLIECAQRIAVPTTAPVVRIADGDDELAKWRWDELFDAWWSVTHAMQKLRDNPDGADSERESARRFDAPGLQPVLTFDAAEDVAAPFVSTGARPKVAILREQGVNSQIEMAWGFDRAGFDAFDVHMSDLIAGRFDLADFHGLAACGGFSYGDVLGAGRGWATSILERAALREMFAAFFARADSFSLGDLQRLPDDGAAARHHPRRRALADLPAQCQRAVRSAAGAAGSGRIAVAVPARHGRFGIPVAVAHGEGRAVFASVIDQGAVDVAARYVEARPRRRQLPGQPERLARRHRRRGQPRRPCHPADAASRAHPAQRQLQLGARRLAGGFAVAADVPQRAGVDRLIPRNSVGPM